VPSCPGAATTNDHTTGTVQVASSPSGAEVYLDNESHGTTPNTITAVPAGSHTVELRENGYDTWSAPVTVTSGSAAKNDLPQIHIDG